MREQENTTPAISAKYYEVLEVATDASPDEIKKAYRQLSLVHHPDKNPQDKEGAAKRFAYLNAIYIVLSDPDQRELYDDLKLAPTPITESKRRKSEPANAEELKTWFLEDQAKYPNHIGFRVALKKLETSKDPDALCANIFKLIQAGRLSYADFEKDRVRNAPWNVIFCDEQIVEFIVLGMSLRMNSGMVYRVPVMDIVEEFYRDHDDKYIALGVSGALMENAWGSERDSRRAFNYNDRLLLYILETSVNGQMRCTRCINCKDYLEDTRDHPSWIADSGVRHVAWVNMLDELFAYRDGNNQLTAKSLRAQLNLAAQFVHGKSVIGDIYQHLCKPIIEAKEKLELEQRDLQRKLKLTFASPEEKKEWQDPDTIRAIKIQQLDEVIKALMPILQKGAQKLLILHKEQLIANGKLNDQYTAVNDTGKQILDAKSQEIFKAAADKVREYEVKPEIKQHRNRVAKILRGILAAVAGLLLTITGAVLFKAARRSYRAGFFDNHTQTVLKEARRDLVEGKHVLKW